jgi:predicted N-acetyltransferase YhbS
MGTPLRAQAMKIRRLAGADLDDVVAIDAVNAGRARRGYFEKRLALALAEPEIHVQFAIETDGALSGYVLARVLEGEFGRSAPSLRLEVIDVKVQAQHHGAGHRLHSALEEEATRLGMHEIRTGADWRDHGMLRFLDAVGYELAANHVIDCPIDIGHFGAAEATAVDSPERAKSGDPNDWSTPAENDFELQASNSAEVRSLAPGDLDAVVRIDRRITGRDRTSYMQCQLKEAMSELAIRVSLIARKDGVPAGFIMAKADFGDFGRAAPVAVIDTIGVDPDFAGAGVGRALLGQLRINLAALQVERLETVVAKENFDLLGFFHAAGFGPSQRLAFVKQLD